MRARDRGGLSRDALTGRFFMAAMPPKNRSIPQKKNHGATRFAPPFLRADAQTAIAKGDRTQPLVQKKLNEFDLRALFSGRTLCYHGRRRSEEGKT